MPKLLYSTRLKSPARALRTNLAPTETKLWAKLRRKQILSIQFYRQRVIGDFIVDFYAPTARLVIELDGSQHFTEAHQEQDKIRDTYLIKQGITVLRFDNHQVRYLFEAVLEKIYNTILAQIQK